MLVASAIAAVGTALIVSRLPPAVDLSMSFTIPVPDRPASGDYEYDGFYALQATDLFAQTLTGWLGSPEVVARVYEQAKLALPTTSVRRLARLFTSRKLSGQLVEIRIRVQSDDEARRLASALAAVIEERVAAVNVAGQRGLTFHVVAGEPLIVPVPRSAMLRALTAFVVTTIVGLNLVILADAFKRVPGNLTPR